MTNRISLKEASRKAPGMLARGDSALLEEGAPPTLSDLAGALQFALGDGRIWLNDERMVLMQTRVFGHLRSEMIEALGLDAARRLFMRTGWRQGKMYADLLRKRFQQDDLTAALAAGPRLHTIEGWVKVTTKRFEFDLAKGHYHGEFHWHDSTEAAEHLSNHGIADCPVCWMQAGTPSGFTSELLGHPVIFREIECAGQGAERCVVIGRNAEEWGDDVPELEIYGLVQSESGPRSKPWPPPVDVPVETPVEAPHAIIGKSAAIKRARRLMEQVAGYDQPVLFLGEPGTGKELFARRLHDIGRTPAGPFVSVNCSMYENGLVDGGLFGEEGSIARARGGTLFLNDVLALPLATQGQLATTLVQFDQNGTQLRVLSATSGDARAALDAEKFRADLFYRLSLLPIAIPPLRERRDDLPVLIEHFLRRHARAHGKPIRTISGSAMDLLLRYNYPGNIRELSNMLERGVIYAEPGGDLDISHIFTGIEEMPGFVDGLHRSGKIVRRSSIDESAGATRSFEEVEAETYAKALEDAGGNVSAAARALGLSRAKLDYRLSKFGITPARPDKGS